MADFIEIKDLVFDYINEETGEETRAIDHLCAGISEGSFTAVLGRNGSGKSTLAKMINVLMLPTAGSVMVDGMDTADEEHTWEIRQACAMVFQNPDNQLVSSIVEDDVAFGPENLGMEPAEIRQRVEKALAAVRMGKYRRKALHQLSGGQKQRIAIAGAVAMHPRCILFDEPTAMLDPQGRREVLEIIRRLHSEGITCILITHYMEEAALADRILVMDHGTICMDGTPREIFCQPERLRSLGLEVPLAVDMAARLRAHGLPLPEGIVTIEELTEGLCRWK
ncbi:MAG: energy-coupling factor transporter ATPase [Eubacteriales bacterium]|nr:energy-coupling factor transporter ATPase [Eubacteriales bacterium]